MGLRFTIAALMLGAAAPAFAYPEFQVYIEQQSGRNVNCAMCHTHPDGPEGLKPGQIGRLDAQQLEALNRARAAFDPGQDVENPILNEFGNAIIRQLGKTRFLALRIEPEELAPALDPAHDLDGDGISDATEMMQGTLPTDPFHGDPASLFWINAMRRWFDILMIGLATAAGLYGLNHLLRGYEAILSRRTPS